LSNYITFKFFESEMSVKIYIWELFVPGSGKRYWSFIDGILI